MHDQPHLVWARARRMLEAYLRPAVHGEAVPLEVSALHVRGEPITVEAAQARAFAPFAVGEAWGTPWDTTWFRMRGTVPSQWAGDQGDRGSLPLTQGDRGSLPLTQGDRGSLPLTQGDRGSLPLTDVVARIGLGYTGQTGFGAEALVWRDGAPVQGISPNHDTVRITGDVVDLLIEAAANPVLDQESATAAWLLPDPDAPPLLRLQRAEICVVHSGLEDFCRDLALVLDLSTQLGAEGSRAGRLLAALRRACMLVDPEQPGGDSLAAAHAPLREALGAPGAPSRHRVVAQAHAHIDTAWLWPVHETRRKCARSFATVLSLMDEHPQLRFAGSQMQHYAWMRDHHPALFARIRARIAEGRWEVVGGMWVESDANIAAAESLVRQLVHGKLFCIEALGVEPEVGWLPDTFGYPATLPQILRESGMPWFVTQKLSWNQVNAFPHSTFWWEGLDGSRVLTHFPPAATYNGDASPAELLRTERSFRDHTVASSSLYLYGYGDGGGGPTRDMLQRVDRLADTDGLPTVEHGGAATFFADTERHDGDALAVWRGELYLERHRGVFTTMAQVKRDNRTAERLLREAEMWSCLHPDGMGAYPAATLDEAWKLTLLHQFHDILPGSSIAMVYDEAARDHRRAHALAQDAITAATQAIAARVDTHGMAEPVLVFNASSFGRREVVEVGGSLRTVSAPACGYATVDAAASGAAADAVTVGTNTMANGLVRITWDDDGLLTSVYDLQAQRECIAPGERGNLLQLFRDHPADYDAWEVDGDDLLDPLPLTQCERIEITESGPLRAAVRVTRRHGETAITQTTTLQAGSPRVDFHITIDWRESHRLLKVAFPVAVRATSASYDVGFGHVERPTHDNTSWDAAQFEVLAYRFADLSEHGYGVALLNRDKHGYDVRGHTLRLTLLRSSTSPHPEADRGMHEIDYALYPHRGGLADGGVVAAAEAFELPLRCVATTPHSGDLALSASVVHVEGANVVVSAVKKAERGEAQVVRVCEVAGGRTTARLSAPAAAASAVWRCDLLERPREPLAPGGEIALGPFQLATLRFESL